MAQEPFPGRSFQQLRGAFGAKFTAIQQPSDLITIMTYTISLLPTVRLGIEADLPHEAQTDDPEISAQREEFMSRILRALCALNLVDETWPFVYQANELTITMTDQGYAAGWMEMYDDTTGPNSTYYQQLQWVRDHGFKAPDDATDGAYQRARNIVGTSTFQHWEKDDPRSLQQLSVWMKSQQKDRLNWHTWLPIDSLFNDTIRDDSVFMVDVGGGFGHDLNAFAAKCPNQKIRLVNQDLPDVINQAREQGLHSRIELAGLNFSEPQPLSLKGAKVYYLHKILHDWPDKDCIRILTHLRDAMAPGSTILINEAILPDQGCPLLLTAFDWTMLVHLSGKERSESMWKRLVSRVRGLSIKKFWPAPEVKGTGFGEAIVEVVRDSSSG